MEEGEGEYFKSISSTAYRTSKDGKTRLAIGHPKEIDPLTGNVVNLQPCQNEQGLCGGKNK